MIDRPAASDLLTAMAATLSDDVVPACTGAPQHAARVVANLCRVLARETELGLGAADATTSDLLEYLSADGTAGPDTSTDDSLAELVASLDTMLAHSGTVGGADLHELFASNVERRLAIAKPAYQKP